VVLVLILVQGRAEPRLTPRLDVATPARLAAAFGPGGVAGGGALLRLVGIAAEQAARPAISGGEAPGADPRRRGAAARAVAIAAPGDAGGIEQQQGGDDAGDHAHQR